LVVFSFQDAFPPPSHPLMPTMSIPINKRGLGTLSIYNIAKFTPVIFDFHLILIEMVEGFAHRVLKTVDITGWMENFPGLDTSFPLAGLEYHQECIETGYQVGAKIARYENVIIVGISFVYRIEIVEFVRISLGDSKEKEGK
jgi:hypothetical protein